MMGVRWLICCLLAGCFKPTFPVGAACTDDGDCPNDQPCVENICGGTAGPPDDAPADSSSIEVDAPDGAAPATQIVLGDNPNELRDAEILLGNQNLGASDHLAVFDNDFSVVRFNVSAIPSTATILEAKLTVRTFDMAATDGGTILVHRLRELWEEAFVTFDLRNLGVSWAKPGALPPSSDPSPVATIKPGAINTDYTVDLPTDLVKAWVSDPGANCGLLFVVGTATNRVHLRSRENGPGSRLTVTYR